MHDVITSLKELLYSEWAEDNPPITGVKFCVQDYGKDTDFGLFDPNACYPQIAIEEIAITNIYVNDTIYRTEHTISIIVYLRPTNYQPATIAASKLTFLAMMEQIDEILKINKFIAGSMVDIQLSTWRIQTDKTKEPIVFVAAQEIKVAYYE